ncbi:NAD(P)H-quinone oxidoreductase subunit H [Candidatus Cyanaurora vandensis]|uniref:NAD(P)H-quinone oxidoreductase subunit H n=1 Tax=Candidatus Cyanaurora vandensis TaxID=2714958 RepID=UPI0037C1B093
MSLIETRTERMVLNLGPHHPSMHGVMHLVVTMNGENIEDCQPIIGYLHRGIEKMAESRSFIQFLTYANRWDYAATMLQESLTAMAWEKLADVPVPRRAQYIRVIMLELSRISSHLLWLGPFMADLGANTPLFYIFRERELVYDLFEAVTGSRLMHNYHRIGGVAADITYGWVDKCRDFCDYFLPKVDEYETLITNNPIFRRRVEGLGVVSQEEAISWGMSGPMLRASGVQWDLRKVDHYSIYDEVEFDVPWDTRGDVFARYVVRIQEMRESTKIIRQCLDQLPGGSFENLEAQRLLGGPKSEWNAPDYQFISKKPAPNFKLPAGEIYVRVESAKGELGAYLIGDGGQTPWRFKVRPPDFVNLGLIAQMVSGSKLADLMAILGSVDMIMGSVDR